MDFQSAFKSTSKLLKSFFPNWLHVIIKVPIILYLLYAFTNYMLYLFSTPKFCQLCHEMKPYYKQWQTSNHSKVGCYDCHGHRDFFGKIYGKIESLSELYHHLTKTFEQPIVSKKLTSDHNCEFCHPDNVKRNLPNDLIDPHLKHAEVHVEGELTILVNGVHKERVEFSGQHCVYCHFNVVHANEKQDRRPQMEFCLDNCHNGRKAPDECDACHTDKPLPESHKASNWYEVHGSLATKIDCKKCHAYTENYCQTCHAKKPKSHTAAWKSTHKFKAKERRQNCYACHQDNFCLKCHATVP